MATHAVLFGLFSGGLVPLGSACVAQTTPDMGHRGLRLGVMMAICSPGALAGGPISGALLSTTEDHKGWPVVQVFSAALTLTGALLMLVVRFMYESRLKTIY